MLKDIPGGQEMYAHAVNNLDLSDEQSYDKEAACRLKFVSADCFKLRRHVK